MPDSYRPAAAFPSRLAQDEKAAVGVGPRSTLRLYLSFKSAPKAARRGGTSHARDSLRRFCAKVAKAVTAPPGRDASYSRARAREHLIRFSRNRLCGPIPSGRSNGEASGGTENLRAANRA